jgi:hypothetical protein
MKWTSMSRAALGAATVALALGFGLFSADGAQASTASADRAQVTGVTAQAAAASGQGPTQTCYSANYCTYSSGWFTYGDGGCEVSIGLLFERSVNLMRVTISVDSPYLFAGCTAYGFVHFGANDGTTYSNGWFWGYACSETDFTCTGIHADPGTWFYTNVTTGIPNATEVGRVTSIWVTATD